VVLWFRVDERWCRCRQRVFELVASVANIACDKLGFDGRRWDWVWRKFDSWESTCDVSRTVGEMTGEGWRVRFGSVRETQERRGQRAFGCTEGVRGRGDETCDGRCRDRYACGKQRWDVRENKKRNGRLASLNNNKPRSLLGWLYSRSSQPPCT
jgi:hypothetical protein